MTTPWRDILLTMTAPEAEHWIEEICAEMDGLTRRELECRIQLGQVLMSIQDRELYKKIRGGHKTWMEFLTDAQHGWPALSGLQLRTAYDAMDLAKSKILASLSERERGKIRSVATARQLVKMERVDPESVTPEVIEQAKTLTIAEFRQAVGASRGYVLRRWFPDADAGREMQRLVELLAGATADALRNFREFLELPEVAALSARAGSGGEPPADNRLDFVVGAAREELHGIEVEAGAAAGVVDDAAALGLTTEEYLEREDEVTAA